MNDLFLLFCINTSATSKSGSEGAICRFGTFVSSITEPPILTHDVVLQVPPFGFTNEKYIVSSVINLQPFFRGFARINRTYEYK